MGDTFLVCVHNVSPDHPYAILRTSVNSTAAEVIKQARRLEADESEFILVEEITEENDNRAGSASPGHYAVLNALRDVSLTRKRSNDLSSKSTPVRTTTRVLAPDENVWKAQSRWKNSGRFILENRRETVNTTLDKVRAFLAALENAKDSMKNDPKWQGPLPSLGDTESMASFGSRAEKF